MKITTCNCSYNKKRHWGKRTGQRALFCRNHQQPPTRNGNGLIRILEKTNKGYSSCKMKSHPYSGPRHPVQYDWLHGGLKKGVRWPNYPVWSIPITSSSLSLSMIAMNPACSGCWHWQVSTSAKHQSLAWRSAWFWRRHKWYHWQSPRKLLTHWGTLRGHRRKPIQR